MIAGRSLIPVAQAAALQPGACTETAGRVEPQEITYSGLPNPLRFRVYLPPCYSSSGGTRYPVLYLLHGLGSLPTQWESLGAVRSADTLISTGQAPPFIIVFPADPYHRQPSRIPYAEAIANGLVPWMDAHYATHPERAYRAIGGLSRGAGWAVHIGLNYPQVFGAVGGHSLPIFVSDDPFVEGWLDAIPVEAMPRIYLDIGASDSLMESASSFEDMLNERSIPHEWHLYTGSHVETYWAAHVEEYLEWYAKGWQ